MQNARLTALPSSELLYYVIHLFKPWDVGAPPCKAHCLHVDFHRNHCVLPTTGGEPLTCLSSPIPRCFSPSRLCSALTTLPLTAILFPVLYSFWVTNLAAFLSASYSVIHVSNVRV